jgi:hypothetical protein
LFPAKVGNIVLKIGCVKSNATGILLRKNAMQLVSYIEETRFSLEKTRDAVGVLH